MKETVSIFDDKKFNQKSNLFVESKGIIKN